MGAMVFALGFAVLFNFIILRVKWNKGQYMDAAVDIGMLIVLNSIFGGSILGVVSATAGSTLISLYLMWKPIHLFESADTDSAEVPEEAYNNTGRRSQDFDDALNKMHSKLDRLFDQTNKEKP